MKQWVTGNDTTAARVDPTVGAIVALMVDIIVRLNIHTQFGVDEATLLQVGLDVAFLVLVVRSIQLNVKKRQRVAAPAEPESEPKPEPEPDAKPQPEAEAEAEAEAEPAKPEPEPTKPEDEG